MRAAASDYDIRISSGNFHLTSLPDLNIALCYLLMTPLLRYRNVYLSLRQVKVHGDDAPTPAGLRFY